MSKWAYGFGRIVPKPAIYLRPRRLGQDDSGTSVADSACFQINNKIDTIKTMSKVVLYRKYRPQSFEEVLGQDHIVAILKNAVKTGRVSHAYLFSGSRGTGKTSLARILAQEAGGSGVDLIEIDGASSRGID